MMLFYNARAEYFRANGIQKLLAKMTREMYYSPPIKLQGIIALFYI
jgi:hypothetical protein